MMITTMLLKNRPVAIAVFLDPINHDLMTDPVITAAGNTYQRQTIETWLRTHSSDPLS